jgi:hypothetical protein
MALLSFCLTEFGLEARQIRVWFQQRPNKKLTFSASRSRTARSTSKPLVSVISGIKSFPIGGLQCLLWGLGLGFAAAVSFADFRFQWSSTQGRILVYLTRAFIRTSVLGDQFPPHPRGSLLSGRRMTFFPRDQPPLAPAFVWSFLKSQLVPHTPVVRFRSGLRLSFFPNGPVALHNPCGSLLSGLRMMLFIKYRYREAIFV